MDYTFLLNNYIYKEEKLLNYGFISQQESYIYLRNLDDEFQMKIVLSKNSFIVHIIDKDFQEELSLLETGNGFFSGSLKNKIQNVMDDIIDKCFIYQNIRESILKFVSDTYHVQPCYPWKITPDACTLKNDKDKWFGLIMSIDFSKIEKNKKGKIDIINIKLPSEKIKELINNKEFFPAYHMNKKYWITILLTNNLSFSTYKQLIQVSYDLVK